MYHRGKGGLIYFAGFGKIPGPKEMSRARQLEEDGVDDEPGRRVMTCSKCGEKGHNARGCKGTPKEGEEQE